MFPRPSDWNRDQVHAFSEGASPHDVAEMIRTLLDESGPNSIPVLEHFLDARNSDVYLKPVPSQYAVRALISLGPDGVEVLRSALVDRDKSVRYSQAVLATLSHLGETGELDAGTTRTGDDLLDLPVPEGTQEAAQNAVRDIVTEALVNSEVLQMIGMLLHTDAIGAQGDPHGATAIRVLKLFAEASIKLSRQLLDEFANLIDEELLEEDYQKFLAENPVLLDPLAAGVVPKQKLGIELATDFGIRRHDNRWLLVEIERPQDKIFTNAGDFRERFVHGFGQVLDFQSWVDDNVAYAKVHMPEIAAPRGLLIIGRSEGLTNSMRTKLRRFVDNSQRIEVLTYDDLLARGTSLFESLHRAG